MEPRWTGPDLLLRLCRLADLDVPRDQSHPEVRDPPLNPLVLEIRLVHVYRVLLLTQVCQGDLVSLGFQAFPVVLFYLLVLSGKAFHL